LGPKLIRDIISHSPIPQITEDNISHIEILGLLVPNIAEDRISDFTASVLNTWLAEFTHARSGTHELPTRRYRLTGWNPEKRTWQPFDADLPYNPHDGAPILLAPTDLLRHLPWINYPDYYKSTYSRLVLPSGKRSKAVAKAAVLAYNRANFEMVSRYVGAREQEGLRGASADPIFQPLSITTLRAKLKRLLTLPTGRQDGADKKYEELAFDLLSSLLYPELDLAAAQSRTDSGAHIRDVIFHNDGKTPFLEDLRSQYGARQLLWN
jgi:hypothetical protein